MVLDGFAGSEAGGGDRLVPVLGLFMADHGERQEEDGEVSASLICCMGMIDLP